MAGKTKELGRLKKRGRSLVWATFTAEEKEKIRAAAGIAGKPMSQLVTESALAASEGILEKFRKSS